MTSTTFLWFSWETSPWQGVHQILLKSAEQGVDGIKGLANELITFSEGGTPVTKIVDLNDLVRQAVKFGLSGSNIDCEYLMSEENCPVEIDEDQVNQVINNLVANAQQAMPGGGKIKVSVQKVEIDKNVSLPATPGSFAKLF